MSKHPNKTSPRSLSNEALAATIIFSNADLTVDEKGWTKIPYGLWQHSIGWQKFGMAEAEAICNAFSSVMGRIKRAITGLPIFKGHPDQPELAREFPDKTEYGQVADMQAQDNCLAIRMVLSNLGADLVEKGLRFISPRWDAHAVGDKDGATIWTPYKMLSIGLVKRPNIPNASLVNHKTDIMDKQTLINLFKLPADSTDEVVTAAVTASAARPTVEALSNAEGKVTKAEREATEAKVALEKANAAVTAASKEKEEAAKSLANEQKAHRTTLVNAAVKDGRISQAQIEIWAKRLETSFEAESKALANLTQTIKVFGTTEQAKLVDLAALNHRLQEMTNEERAEWSKTGVLTNDDGDTGDDMANVGKLCKLVNKEMQGDAYANIKDPNEKWGAAMRNVLRIHKNFLAPKAAA